MDPVCTAFPESIPRKIEHGYVDHRRHVEGDNGVLFEIDHDTNDSMRDRVFRIVEENDPYVPGAPPHKVIEPKRRLPPGSVFTTAHRNYERPLSARETLRLVEGTGPVTGPETHTWTGY